MRRLLPFLAILAMQTASAQSGTYQITHTYTVGGAGSWDYVVPEPARLQPLPLCRVRSTVRSWLTWRG